MAQIKKKFLASNAVDGTKVQFSNDEAFRVKSASGNDVELFKLDGSNIFQFLQMPRIGSDPTEDNDLSRKSYVDAQVMSEAAARVQADAQEQSAREAAIAAEQSAREEADNVLQLNIDSEASSRQEADTLLQAAIDALTLDSLTDVSMSSPGSGDVLRYNGSQWTKEAPVDSASSGGGGSGLTEVVAPTTINTYTANPTSAVYLTLISNSDQITNFSVSTVSPGVGLVTWDSAVVGKDSASLSALPIDWTTANFQPQGYTFTDANGDYTSWDFTGVVTGVDSVSGGFLFDIANSMLSKTQRINNEWLTPVSLTPEQFSAEASITELSGGYQVSLPAGSVAVYLNDQSYQSLINFNSIQVGDCLTVKRIMTESVPYGSDEHWKFQIQGMFPRGPLNSYDAQLVYGQFIEYYQYATQLTLTTFSGYTNLTDFDDPIFALEYKVERTVSAPGVSSAGKLIKANVDGKLDQSFLQYNVNFGGNVLSGVSSPVAGTDAANKTWVEGQVASEQSARESADAGLQSQIDALSGNSSAGLAQEIADRQAADAGLQSQIDTEKGRIDAILLASDADKDSFAEIVQLINSVDTTNDQAFASYVLSNDAALAQEVSDRQAGDSQLQSNIDAEQSAREQGDANLQSALDQEVSDRQAAVSAEQSAREQADTTLQSNIDAEEQARIAAVSAEASARQSADDALDARLDIIEGSDTTEGSVAKAEKDAKDYADSIVASEQSAREQADSDLQDAIDAEVQARQTAVSGEEAARMAADSGIQSELDATQTGAGLGVDGSYTAPVGSSYLGSASSLKDADSKLDAAISAEVNARTTAIANVEQSIADLDAAMTQGLDDANAYTDSKISALIDGAPALLDTLNELAAAIGDDENFASNIMTAVANEATARQNADTAEAQARDAADETLQSNIDAEQAAREAAVSAEQAAREAADAAESAARTAELPRHAKVRYTLTSTDISNGYVDLDHVALSSSCNVFIDRLACHESDDYILSTVDGVTRVTFSSGFMSSGEAPEAGDLFRCSYAYKNSDQV